MNIHANLTTTESGNISNNSTVGSFSQFVLKKKRNKVLLIAALVGTIVQLIIFKSLYPFPDFISDSWSYIATNVYNMDVNLWPIGYSKFLWFVHLISNRDTFLIAVQYFLLQAGLMYFFFSISYLYQPSGRTKLILFIFLLFNPMTLYLSNCVLSDALFATLTIILIVQFLWMLHRPNIQQVALQGIIIGLAFTIRYTAIYYPLFVLAGMLLSRHRPIIKISGILLGVILIVPFVLYTKQKTKEVTGTAEFSVFGGWQIANNALYMYNHIIVDTNKLPPETRALDKFSKQFFKNTPPKEEELQQLPGTYFIKVPWAILKPYMAYRYTYDDPPGQFKAWGKVSPIYNQYGSYLIRHFPVAFAKYYLWLNTKNYFLPHLEKFETYNLTINTVPSHVQDWFGYTTPDVYAVSVTFQGKLFYAYPILFMLLNIFYGFCILSLLLTGKFNKLSLYFKSTLILVSTYLLVNFGFSVFATPVVIRYQIVPIIILFTFSLLLIDNLDQKTKIGRQ